MDTNRSYNNQQDNVNSKLRRRISLAPLKGGGTNRRTHKLVKKQGRLEYKPTFSIIMVYLFVISIGVIPGYFMLKNMGSIKTEAFLFPITFIGIGIISLIRCFRPNVFDLEKSVYWRGFKEEIAKKTELNEIAALQIISENNSTSKASGGTTTYKSYELNLVLKNKTRVNVVDHGNYEKLAPEAEKISGILDVPLWDEIH